MENFPSNARSPKLVKPTEKQQAEEQEPRVQRVVEGEVIRRKKSLGKRFAETFIGDAKGVWNFVFMEVLIPAARDMVVDAGQQALERTFYGESRGGRGRIGRTGHTNYRNISTSKAVAYRHEEPRAVLSRRARVTHDFDELILPSRREADDTIAQMFETLERYNQVTVADLYDITNVESSYTDRKYGWVDLSTADIKRVRDGYLLDLPRPEPLD